MSFLKKLLGLDKKDCKCVQGEKCGCSSSSSCCGGSKPAEAPAQPVAPTQTQQPPQNLQM